MAVFTTVDRPTLERLLADYDIGTLTALEGIPSGVVNTNYFVTTTAGRYVLTLFERLPAAELPWFVSLMQWLAARGVPCPRPVADRRGRTLMKLAGRPATLVTRLPGASVESPGPEHCAAVGAALARLHLAGDGFAPVRPNPHDARWAAQACARLRPAMTPAGRALAARALRDAHALARAKLPRGIVHADLFRDNVLFTGTAVSGIIDFYYACHDALVYDLAITATDWCRDAGDALDEARLRALATGYAGVRPLTAAERDAWPAALSAAALRFWLSRLEDWHQPRGGALVTQRDPAEYARVLASVAYAPAAWPL